ncbi:MAG: 2-phospho-L-lactate guanylyltransferase [Chloroflexi bacterium]|nr:2-phospho-L-lactate guanylyltransferase [Chloroflexota bacterium]
MTRKQAPIPHSAFRIPHSIWAIIPVKPLHESKRRLAHILSADERAALIQRFLAHTLTVLNQAKAIDRILAVSGDEWVLDTARNAGADVLVETAVSGLNSAVTQAVKFAEEGGATAVLILPADLPFIQTEDVAIMVTAGANSSRTVICSDDIGSGTNALLISPPNGFTFHYGANSFQHHLQEAAQHGLVSHIVHAPGLKFDLDTEEDWQQYQFIIHNSPFTIQNS